MKLDERVDLEVYASVGGAAFFEQLLSQWERDGWQVSRHHALQEQEYRAARSTLQRMRLRWRMYGTFAWKCWRTTRQSRGRAPLRVVTTNPFFAPALVARTAKGSGATINLLYDLYPDALVQAGVTQPDSWLARRCAALTRMALHECAATVFLGERLRRHAEASYGASRKGVVIPVGADGTPFRDTPPRLLDSEETVTVLYAGQMGRMHEIETVGQVLRAGIPRRLKLVFHASGAGYNHLRESSQGVIGCTWGEPLAPAVWQKTMADAQLALVTMAPGAENVVMPSKTYSALVAGQAIVAVCAIESDLADLVRRYDCGWIVEPGDFGALRNCLQEICSNPVGLLEKRQRAFEAGHSRFESAIVAREWNDLFGVVLNEKIGLKS
jgi:colanic acid biosynthesis glycosyl transferase WcaI